MKTSKELKENRGLLEKELIELGNKDKFTETEEKRIDEIGVEIEGINLEIEKAEKRETLLKDAETRSSQAPVIIKTPKSDNDEQVKKHFSIRKMIWDIVSTGNVAGLEKEIVEEGIREAREAGINTSGFVIPSRIIGNDKKTSEERYYAKLEKAEKRATLTTSTGDTPKAGYFIQTDVYTNDWIDVLRNKLVLVNAGAIFWDGLEGNVSIPKKTQAATVAWLTETGTITSNNQVHGAVTMTPHRVGGAVPFTKTLLRQQSVVGENYVRNDIANGLAQALQLGALSGSGSSNQPTGIITAVVATNGANYIKVGTNGGAPTWELIVEMQKQVDLANANMGNIAYLFNAATRGKMKTVKVDSGSGIFLCPMDGNVNGEKTYYTNALRSNLDKGTSTGVCSEAVFGNWEDLVIGSWGGLDIVVDPYSLSKSNQIEVIVNGFYDIGILREPSFSVINDFTTT